MSAAGALIQAACFSGWVIQKMRCTWRSLLFVLLFFPVLSFAVWKTEWFAAGTHRFPGQHADAGLAALAAAYTMGGALNALADRILQPCRAANDRDQ